MKRKRELGFCKSPKLKRKQLQSVFECVEYLLDTEFKDFKETPSREHIYYHAYLARFGPILASEVLDIVIAENEEI